MNDFSVKDLAKKKMLEGYLSENQLKKGADQALNDTRMLEMLTGTAPFRDTGRKSSGPGEAMDSIAGAPVRKAIEELQRGNFDFSAIGRVAKQVGADPKTAPTGYDIAEKVTDNPYLGAALATAVDVGAQAPIPGIGVPGIIKELDGPLYHGTPRKFPTSELKASQGGYVGPGVYMADDANVARRYGENLHAANPKKVNIVDLMSSNDDALLVAKQLGIEDGFAKRIASKYPSGPLDQTGRFYALQDALIEKIDPNGALVGNERAQALIDALKGQGYTGLKYKHQDAPAFNIFDPENLRPAHKYTVKSKDESLRLYSEPAQASGILLDPDSVESMDPEIMEHLKRSGLDPQQLFRLETLESYISGYGAKALKKMEESAQKRGAEVSYLNAAPMGYLGRPPGMTQEQSAAKLRDYYQKHGYEPVKDYGTNTMMLKKLSKFSGEP